MEVDGDYGYKNICRVCLEEGANLSLYKDEEDMKVYQKIMACSTVQIVEDDGFPNNICPTCHVMLNTAFEFKQRCETSDVKLRSLPKESIKTEDNDDYVFPETYLYTADYNSDDDVKSFEPNDETLLNGIKIKEEADEDIDVRKMKLRKKKKWKTSNESHKIFKKEKGGTTNVALQKRRVANRIATSLLEGSCVWNGRNWRFNASAKFEEEKKKDILIDLPKIMKEQEETKLAKKMERKRRRMSTKKDRSASVNLCDTCGVTFKSRHHLKYHIMLKHQELQGTIKCKDPDCKKLFKLDHYMQRHLKRCHSSRREFICNECGKQYAFISGLRQHMKSHSGTEVWKHCTFCTQKYRTQKSVDIHIRSVHTGERPSVCTMCDSAFFHDDYLKEHMRLHTGETPYKCPICKRGYAQRGNMKSHMKQHRLSELDETMKATMKPNYMKLLRDC